MKLISDIIGALFGLFALFLLYVFFIYEARVQVEEKLIEQPTTMEEAIKILNDRNKTIAQTKQPSITHDRAQKIIKNLKDIYNIQISEEDIYKNDKSYSFHTAHDLIEKRLTISLVWHNVEVYTNSYSDDFKEYFNTCSAVLISLLDAQKNDIKTIENNLMQIFKEALEVNKGQSVLYKMKDVEIKIKPDSAGILGCQYYQNGY